MTNISLFILLNGDLATGMIKHRRFFLSVDFLFIFTFSILTSVER